MRIICAPDSFKESLTAREAAEAMARGARAAGEDVEVELCPIGDGGEGTLDALVSATGGRLHELVVRGPLGETRTARWGWLGTRTQEPDTAIVEMAEASGLQLVPEEKRDPTKTTTYGTGQLIAAALDAGAQRIILAIGGSATNDGGCGCAQALGARFIDHDGEVISDLMCGALLDRIQEIDLSQMHPRLARIALEIASDVTNPLCGPEGSAAVYGPQKGADEQQVLRLDRALAHLATKLPRNVRDMPGAGAAGGFGGGAVGMLGGTISRGIERVLELVRFDERVRGADVVFTGEGKMDGQSLSGKAVMGIVRAAKNHGVPTVAMVGAVGERIERVVDEGLDKYVVISEGIEKRQAIRRAAELLEKAAKEETQARRA